MESVSEMGVAGRTDATAMPAVGLLAVQLDDELLTHLKVDLLAEG